MPAAASGADFRSLNTREAAGSAPLDVRSPNTRDAAAPRDPHALDALERLQAEAGLGRPPLLVEAPGFDWAAAGVGAAATLGLVLLVGGAGLLRGYRRDQAAGAPGAR